MSGFKSIFGLEMEKLPQTVKRDDKKLSSSKSKQQGSTHRTGLRDTLLFTLLFVVLNVVLRVNSASYLRKSRLHVFFMWLQSLISLLFLWISRRGRRWSFVHQAQHLKALPVLCCYVVHVAINECYSNNYRNTSGGPEVLQLGLATSPLFIILAQTWFHKKADAGLVTIFVVLSSLIITVIFCSENDPYIPYKFTMSYGIFGLLHGLTLAIFVFTTKKYLTMEEISISELIQSINLGCVLCLPFVMLFNGEMGIIIASGLSSHGGFSYAFFTAFILALLRIFDQISSFYHIKNSSNLLHIAARTFAWIPITLIITFTMRMELLISSFLGFWLVGAIFIAALVEEITDINS